MVRAAQGFDLFGLRLSEAGVIEGLAVANLTAQDAPLKPLGDLLRSLRDASAPPPSEQLLDRAMGRAPNQLRPVVIGAVASGSWWRCSLGSVWRCGLRMGRVS